MRGDNFAHFDQFGLGWCTNPPNVVNIG